MSQVYHKRIGKAVLTVEPRLVHGAINPGECRRGVHPRFDSDLRGVQNQAAGKRFWRAGFWGSTGVSEKSSQPCPACGGTGSVWSDYLKEFEDCDWCCGTGKIENRDGDLPSENKKPKL